MSKWISGAGFYYVQPTDPINAAENKKQMELLEERLQNAERRLGNRKEQTA